MLCKLSACNALGTYKYVVVLSRQNGKILLSRHKERATWETQLFDGLPDNLTYPDITPVLFAQLERAERQKNAASGACMLSSGL